MGIYESGNIFGIRINNFNNILFEKIYNKKVYLFYTELNNKNKIQFEYYSECSSTYGEEDTFLMWCPMSFNLFLEKFSI